MGDILVLVEHRQGEIREITYQMLWKANELSKEDSRNTVALLLGGEDAQTLIDPLKERADKVIYFKDKRLEHFDGAIYKEVIHRLLNELSPYMVLIGQTPWGMDIAPALSIKTGLPMVSDCVDIMMEGNSPKAIRQIYNGKIFSKVSFKEADSYIITIRPGTFSTDISDSKNAQVEVKELYPDIPTSTKQFIGFDEAGVGEVDISQAELLVSIGRGIGEQDNIPIIQELAEKMGGMLSCSRPIVDKKWLPKYHQVGTSGKSVKPKVYLALGISGAFQHVAGITGAGTVIAINKDPKAPIFRVANYGVVDDMFKIVNALKQKLSS